MAKTIGYNEKTVTVELTKREAARVIELLSMLPGETPAKQRTAGNIRTALEIHTISRRTAWNDQTEYDLKAAYRLLDKALRDIDENGGDTYNDRLAYVAIKRAVKATDDAIEAF